MEICNIYSEIKLKLNHQNLGAELCYRLRLKYFQDAIGGKMYARSLCESFSLLNNLKSKI